MGEELKRFEKLLRYAYGGALIVFGIDKFFNLLVSWQEYVSPYLVQMGISPSALVHFAGVVEIILGSLLLSKWILGGAYALMGWLVLIVINLITSGGHYDIVIQDFLLMAGVYGLIRLTAIRALADAGRA